MPANKPLIRGAVLMMLAVLALPARSDPEPLTLEIRGLQVTYNPFTLVAQPGEALSIGLAAAATAPLLGHLNGQPAGTFEAGRWLLSAPSEPGIHSLALLDQAGTGVANITLLVNVPAERLQQGELNGYRIGPTPPGHPRHADLYTPPAGFIEVIPKDRETQLTPHFKLRQFMCKQSGGYPKYVVIDESLLLLLEGLVAAVQEAGHPIETFGVISAYRTPWYNKLIGNVANSRHVYGNAMDLYVDVDGDGRMDDLNGDGVQDRADVDLLADLVEEFMQRPENAALVGGVGRYGKNSRHGGFVHVDTRGYPARW